MSIKNNLNQIQTKIATCCAQYDRLLTEVKLLAVSKTKPIDDLMQAYLAGQIMFGENYVQEGIEKVKYFQAQNIKLEWHFIGNLQANKTKEVAKYFDWVQTIDRPKIADRLSSQRPTDLPELNVLIQLNISNEESKSGILADELFTLAEHIMSLDNLCLRGIMAIPEPIVEGSTLVVYEQMQQLFNQLQQKYPQVDTLSLGMSDDMQLAIQYGSTMVRIGSAIFGHRS